MIGGRGCKITHYGYKSVHITMVWLVDMEKTNYYNIMYMNVVIDNI